MPTRQALKTMVVPWSRNSHERRWASENEPKQDPKPSVATPVNSMPERTNADGRGWLGTPPPAAIHNANYSTSLAAHPSSRGRQRPPAGELKRTFPSVPAEQAV